MSVSVSAKRPVVQSSLRVGAVSDPAELEADAVADRVMTLPDVDSSVVRRCPGGCPEDEVVRREPVDEEEDEGVVQRQSVEDEEEAGEDEEVQAKVAGGGRVGARLDGVTAAGIGAVRGGGAPMPGSSLSFFGSRFGADFSPVRVHADGGSARLASSVGARAFTLGRDVFFAEGEYRPGTPTGDRLLAHELTHTLQQNRNATIRRTVNVGRSRCRPNVHNAPVNPIAAIRAADQEAQRMALGASNVLFLESVIHSDPTFGPGAGTRAYNTRFGRPQRLANRRFRNRFTGRTHSMLNTVMSQEMGFLSRRYERIHDFLSRPIDYDCPGTAAFTVGSCTGRCGPNDGAHSCHVGHGRQIKICAGFWNGTSLKQRAGMIIHEVGHMRFRFGGHGSANQRRRGRNPECYTSYLADTESFAVWDSRCPAAGP